ncbi:hypothetical protein B0919_23645 [Hymenobacter sp. CRA2]|nr:hypothetical protein B0919_23645 [Hymenobacter sp. CRA2]
MTDDGRPWTPIGQNDAVTWPELAGLFRRQNVAAVEGHLVWLAAHGVTVLRLMLEYCQTENRYLERPVGRFQPNMVQFWDDLFGLCEKHGLRLLLTPYDTFWMWRRWGHHPYNQLQGGPCARRTQWLRCPATRQAIKSRLSFAAERWGGSGALFGWDLWNEIHPLHAGRSTAHFAEFIDDVGRHLQAEELRFHGRSHLQTVSVFGPTLAEHPELAEVIFRHPQLDFATTHFYDKATIDRPRNTVAPARRTAELVREALAHLSPARPFFDTEHGPIAAFRRRTLPEPFDDEYFRHMQWAHLAAGGAGGGLRWPYRHPHQLTPGMRAAQRSLADFCQLINWPRFRRRNLDTQVQLSTPAFAAFACGDERQAVVWLLRQDRRDRQRLVLKTAKPLPVQLMVPGLAAGAYHITLWDTQAGRPLGQLTAAVSAGELCLALPPVVADIALAIVRA